MSKLTAVRRPEVQRGEVECVNCGRTLALALRRASDGAVRLFPHAGGALEVEVCDGARLRCTRCGGRAFVEFDRAGAA